jgi:hypothetical protein
MVNPPDNVSFVPIAFGLVMGEQMTPNTSKDSVSFVPVMLVSAKEGFTLPQP